MLSTCFCTVMMLKVYATDRDAGENARISYELRRDPSGFFSINPNTGWVTVARPMTGVRISISISVIIYVHCRQV